MKYSPENAVHVLAEARRVLDGDEPDTFKAERAWRTFAYMRALVLARLLSNTIGAKVYSGPFKGMQLTPAAMKGIYGPHLSGLYEHELHNAVEHVIGTPYAHILNIGCAFGYYAVGFALRMPNVKIHAFDIDEDARLKVRDMADLNGVAGRITIGDEFRGEDYAHYADSKTLVFMDIEGAEKTLLDPALYPALRKMDIIVELHECLDPGLAQTVMKRFNATHDMDLIINKAALFDFEPLIGKTYTDPFDSLLMTWENRDGETPWAFMRVKESG